MSGVRNNSGLSRSCDKSDVSPDNNAVNCQPAGCLPAIEDEASLTHVYAAVPLGVILFFYSVIKGTKHILDHILRTV